MHRSLAGFIIILPRDLKDFQLSFDYEQAYKLMFLIRRTEEEIIERYHRDERMRCPTHLSIGQEAPAAGLAMALEPGDQVWAYHRGHAHYIAKGGSLEAMIGELYGKANGCNGGWGGSMYLTDESVGFGEGSTAVGDGSSFAIGSAMAYKMDGSGRWAVSCFGDAAVETGQFWESLNMAALHQLPVIFVCENNGYSTATPLSERQPDSPIYQRVQGFIESVLVEDGSVEEIYKAVSMFRGSGPGFVEVPTYRFREHVGPNYDWDLGYRTREEVEEEMARDQLITVRARISDTIATEIESAATKQVMAAFDAAENAPWPDISQLEERIWADVRSL